MPLRDHFRPPVDDHNSWDELHGMWPAEIVHFLFGKLPPGYSAAPKVHLGRAFEVDVTAFENYSAASGGTGTATATQPAAIPTHTLDADLSEEDEYEVRIFDTSRNRQLVAAIEIVSPANKDRPDHRRAFTSKCAALLRREVCVSIVDVVTTKQFNLYAETLAEFGGADPTLGADPPNLYAVTMRPRKPARGRSRIESVFRSLELGAPLPSIPLWLAEDTVVMLDLDPPYEDACRVLHIR